VVTEVETIKREIINNGPVVTVIPIYRDFLVYKEGVYKVSENSQKLLSSTAVKVLGWGQNENNKYWIVEGSWGSSWG
jgi:cathepsin B